MSRAYRYVVLLILAMSILPSAQVRAENDDVSRIFITEVNLQPFNDNTDLFVDIYYNYSFVGEERLVDEKLFLSLDNESFIVAIHRTYIPEDMNATGNSGFFFANSIGDPLPFDVYEGDTLYGYIAVNSTESNYRTEIFAEVIPITVIRSFLFRIPSILIFGIGFVLSILPLAACIYCLMNRKKNANQIS